MSPRGGYLLVAGRLQAIQKQQIGIKASRKMPATKTVFTQTIFERSADYPTGMVAPTIVLLIAVGFVVLLFMRRRH